ncbi:MAG: DUF4338 domain-containing protein [Phycisphaerae bacterium]|nr:DUF4338 domain-containing protein [Phycisphaerae bacterium]
MRTIPLLTLESQIKRGFRRHLLGLGFSRNADGGLTPPSGSKEAVRALHAEQRRARLAAEKGFVATEWPKLKEYFADGSDVDPTQISPRLELIASDTWQSRLFRLASLTWSVPVSQGYGRRMRFLVWDDFNGRLIGLIALGDPVFNLSVRDEYIGWNAEQRRQRLVNVMDAYVLGAVPPYNSLLGGKLLASLVRSQEVRDAFAERYADATGIISKTKKRPELVLVTTTSALGRSSVYNRLKLKGSPLFKPIGFTKGWGHFHVTDSTFDQIRQYLKRKRHRYASGFKYGDGPNWRLRATRLAVQLVGLRPELLRHGVQREVYVCELATNAKAVLRGRHKRAKYPDLLSAKQVSDLARERWVEPRAGRCPEYKLHKRDAIVELLRRTPVRSAISLQVATRGSCAT